MKIRKIAFKNIHNLKGEHSISFDQEPLSSAGIFAIVGPTGSGKSTILDVITLALFNRIPRFKKAITKSEIEDLGSVLTHHTSEASALVEYEIKGHRYTSSWSVTKARTGNLKDYEMYLYDANGTPLDLKKSQVPAKNSEIIGLEYDQFVKSIILSQGEFAKFLKADKHERGQLLENITGTSIYRKIGIKAFEKQKEVKESVEKKKEILGVIQILTDEERKEFQTEIDTHEKEKAIVEKQLGEALKVKQLKTEIRIISESIIAKQKEAEILKSKTDAFQQSLEKLLIHEKLSPVSGQLAIYNEAVTKSETTVKNLTDYNEQLSNSNNNLKEVIDEMSELTGKNVNRGTFIKTMSSFEAEVKILDNDLKNILEKGEEERKRINVKISQQKLILNSKIKPVEAVVMLEERANELNKILVDAEVDKNIDLQDINAKIKTGREEITQLEELTRNYEQVNNLTKRRKDSLKKLKEFKAISDKNKPLIETATKLVTTSNEQLNLQQEHKLDAIKIAELKELRTDLVEGEPCPLCGSTDHPYAAHNPVGFKKEIDKNIEESRTKVEKETANLYELKKKHTESKNSAEMTQTNIRETEYELNEEKKKSDDLIKSYQGKVNTKPERIDKGVHTLIKNHNLLENAAEAFHELKRNQELTDDFGKLSRTMERYNESNKQRSNIFQGDDVSPICNKLQDEFAKCETEITQLKTTIGKEKADLKRAQEVVKSIGTKLKSRIEQLGFESIKEISSHLLVEDEANIIKRSRDELAKLKSTNEGELKSLIEQKDQKTKSDTAPELDLNVLEKSISEKKGRKETLRNNITERQSQLKRDDEDRIKVKEKQKEIEKMNEELEKWSLLNRMIGDATGNKFANFAQGLTLQNLLVYSNRRLEYLSDRYLLDKPTEDDSLVVIDQYQGNIQRAVTTLSGGESFIISLALALSMSDMASRNVAMDSLFIDEGFGTLDQETLDIAMTTLEKLQSESQKTVAVISHVEALKERINVKIKLEKNAQGYGCIDVEG